MFFNKPGMGRKKSSEYMDWIVAAGWCLKEQHIKPIQGRVVIEIDLDDTRQGDAANREKGVTDLLVKHGIIQGDSKKYVKRVSIGWEKVDGCQVRITAVEPP